MKETEFFNFRKGILWIKATWSEYHFLHRLIVLLLFCSLNAQALAASGGNMNSNAASSESEDKMNAPSFLQGISPEEDDEDSTFIDEVGAVIVGMAALAVMAKGYKDYHSSSNIHPDASRSQPDNHMSTSGSDNMRGPVEVPVLPVVPTVPVATHIAAAMSEEMTSPPSSCRSPENDRSSDSDLATVGNRPRTGSADMTAIRNLKYIKDELKALHQVRNDREQLQMTASATKEPKGFFFSLAWWNSRNPETSNVLQGVSQQKISPKTELKVSQLCSQLTPRSDLDEIKVVFLGLLKDKLTDVLDQLSSDDNEQTQKKFAYFAAKKNFSAEHLNGYLELLQEPHSNLNLAKEIELQVNSFWDSEVRKYAAEKGSASSSGEYPVAYGVPVPEEQQNLGSSEVNEDSFYVVPSNVLEKRDEINQMTHQFGSSASSKK